MMAAAMAADVLRLPFGVPIGGRDSAALPLPFVRRRGDAPDVTAPVAQLAKVAAAWPVAYDAALAAAVSLEGGFSALPLVLDDRIGFEPAAALAFCRASRTGAMLDVSRCHADVSTRSFLLSLRKKAVSSAMAAVFACDTQTFLPSLPVVSAAALAMPASADLRKCQTNSAAAAVLAAKWLATGFFGAAAVACHKQASTPALPVPCEYYEIPIPEPEPPLPDYACGIRPRADQLPLAFTRRRIAHDAAFIPLPFACGSKTAIPVLKAYMLLNTVTAATDDGQPLTPLSASFTSDTDGYCWQGTLTLPPEDFARLNMDGRRKGREAQITVDINNLRFVFIAEESSDERRFGNKTYTVRGRSLTARLGESYAVRGSGGVDAPMYAQQIAREQLVGLPYRIERYTAPDWLVPGDVYSYSDKTPIGVLTELAQAAGAFVESHPYEPWLSIKPRWRVPAWQVAEAVADVVVPASVITQISGSRREAARANGVFVWGAHSRGQAADVYRRGTAREPRASALTHALYTDQPVLQAAGIAALSDTGTHKIETVTLPVAEKYALPLAEKGQIWQIAEPAGSWQGVVTGVTLEVTINKDVPEVWQTVAIDRYLDD